MQQMDGQMSETVTYRFRNIGPVKDAELQLGDLTIIAGRNNTGKTYIAYTLYGFLAKWTYFWRWFVLPNEKWADAKFPDWEELGRVVSENGRFTFPLDDKDLALQRERVIQRLTQGFSEKKLSEVFSSQDGAFDEASLEVSCSFAKLSPPASYRSTVSTGLSKGRSVSICYDGNHVVVTVDEERDPLAPRQLAGFIAAHYVLFLLENLFPNEFVLPAERIGISLFYRELDFAKNELVDFLQKLVDEEKQNTVSPYLIIERGTSRYALPIKDNIDYTRSIPDLRARKSELYEHKLFNDIKDLMDGYYSAAGDEIRFISKARGKGRSFNIPLHLASSSARGLSDFYFFLRHVAKSNHLLIIDEPESHLDTANQIQLARLLARFVRAGLKVLITTHSDYIIKEINNLVMLSQPFADKDVVLKKLKYRSDVALDGKSIRAYVAENNSLTRCDVDKFGIDMPVFDTTINQINKVANELASRLAEETEM